MNKTLYYCIQGFEPCKLSGYEPDVDIPVVYTGLRPGEKLYEELLINTETLTKTENNVKMIFNKLHIILVERYYEKNNPYIIIDARCLPFVFVLVYRKRGG